MKRLFTNRLFHFILLFVFLLLGTAYSASDHHAREFIQHGVFDTYNKIKPRPRSDDIIIVDLDEASLEQLGQWPWPRTVMATLVDNLTELGAKSIGFDMVFAEPDRTSPATIIDRLSDDEQGKALKEALRALHDNDEVFADAIKQSGRVITGFTRAELSETLRAPAKTPPMLVASKKSDNLTQYMGQIDGLATNLPAFSKNAAANAHFSASAETDGIIRRVKLMIKPDADLKAKFDISDKALYPLLGMDALRVGVKPSQLYIVKRNKDKSALNEPITIGISKHKVPVNHNFSHYVYYRDMDAQDYISAHEVINLKNTEQVGARIKDKIVFIGTSAEGLKDIRSTPLGLFEPGVEVHANVAEQILQGAYLTRPDGIIGGEAIAIFVIGLIIIALTPFVSLIWTALVTFSAIPLMGLVSWYGFSVMGLLIDPVYPALIIFALFVISTLLGYIRSEAEKSQIRGTLGQYVAPDYIKELIKNPDRLKLGGETKELSVMFTDIRSFTSISESLSPEELTQLMNDFLTD